MSNWWTLTGRQRYRAMQRGWGRPPLIVLQVEWALKLISRIGEDVERTEWRDARLEDISHG